MIELNEIRKAYTVASFAQTALDGVSLAFRDNEFVAVLGPSGSGKTTLLNILGGLDHADSGDIVINGVSTQEYKDADWDTYRNHRIGFIFQSYNLIPHQTICSNVELALTLSGVPAEERKKRAIDALKKVGLGDHVDKKPSQLSGGQMQRVAIARALINDPTIVLADEPTGALDTETGIQVMDLLSEIAQDRLVIMVTHNPDLAERYANRIVRLNDGRITGDTNPLEAAEIKEAFKKAAEEAGVASDEESGLSAEQVQAEVERDAAKGSKKYSSMSFITALSLSFNNLMTKKTRTFLTAFAGSIGIIGIAAILALSNGVNNYIAKTESEALSSFPLTITKSSFNMASLLTADFGNGSDENESYAASSGTGNIRQVSIMTDLFAEVKNNDLRAFKEYLDSGKSNIDENASAIQYSYDIDPLIYSVDTSDGIKQLSPSKASKMISSGISSSAFSMGSMGMESFQQIIDDEELMERQMDVVTGRWPAAYDEAVLVLSSDGTISDYTLYSIGIYDPDKLETMFQDVLAGNDVDLPKLDKDFSYEDAMGMMFSVVSPSATYKKSEDGNTWTDMSGDSSFMKNVINEGVSMKIVGVVQPKEDAGTVMLTEGVAYSGGLIKHLMDQAANSQIVKDQLADPERDIFTGKTFEELESEGGPGFDMDSLFTIDEAALQSAFSFDASGLSGIGSDFDLSDADLGLTAQDVDFGDMQIDASAMSSVFGPDAIRQIMAGVPPFTLDSVGMTDGSGITPEQQQAVVEASSQLVAGYTAFLIANGYTDGSDHMGEYMATADAQFALARLSEAVAGANEAIISNAMKTYMETTVANYLSSAFMSMMDQAAQLLADQIALAMTTQIAAMTDSLGSTLTHAITGELTSSISQLSSALQNGFSFNADAFAGAFQFNMSEDDLKSLMSSFMNSSSLSYEGNLSKLGYATEDDPFSISIYPKSFESKDIVKDAIEKYNNDAKAAGEEDRSIDYNDMAGILMSSVNSIVNMISLVLIAFVSISLVVSSIMIGIITYISVLERKKEIGILRAMGASKGNIANVFNAETIIEGLMAGVFAIALIYLVSIPVNAIVLSLKNVGGILALPISSALILIAVSVFLTFIAGLIPSTAASRRDPVEALRSE